MTRNNAIDRLRAAERTMIAAACGGVCSALIMAAGVEYGGEHVNIATRSGFAAAVAVWAVCTVRYVAAGFKVRRTDW